MYTSRNTGSESPSATSTSVAETGSDTDWNFGRLLCPLGSTTPNNVLTSGRTQAGGDTSFVGS